MHTRSSGLLACLLALGCQPELELPPVIEASNHLILRGEDDVCAGTFDEMEARVLAIQELFDAPPVQVGYNWLGDRFPEANCPDGASACTQRYEIFAKDLDVEHELVHAARTDSLPAPLEEGLASFLGSIQRPRQTREELRVAIETNSAFSYQRASEFVQFLVDIGGFDTLAELARGTGYASSFSDWRPVFERVYGQTWDEVWADYLASPACDWTTMRDDVFLCYASTTPAVNLTPPTLNAAGEYLHEMSCDDGQVVGPVNDDALRHEVLIELDSTPLTTVVVALRGDLVEGSRATLTRCGTCAGEDGVVLAGVSGFDFLKVVPGQYVLELHQPIDEPGSIGVSVHY